MSKETEWRRFLPKLMEHGSTEEHLNLLILMAQQLQLDPLLGEIVICRGKVYVTLAGLYRRANELDILDGVDTSSTRITRGDPYNDGRGERYFCEPIIYKRGCAHPFTTVVDELEYRNPRSNTWQQYPMRMLMKCGEALLLRRILNIAVPTLEEVGYDEVTGTTTDDAHISVRIENAEQIAVQAKAAKRDAREAKRVVTTDPDAAIGQNSDEFRAIGMLYRLAGWPRDAEEEGIVSTKGTFYRLCPVETDEYAYLMQGDKHGNEAYLKRSHAQVYLAALAREVLSYLAASYSLPQDRLEAHLAHDQLPSPAAWNDIVRQFLLDVLHHLADLHGVSPDDVEAAAVASVPGCLGIGELQVHQLKRYVDSLLDDLTSDQPSA